MFLVIYKERTDGESFNLFPLKKITTSNVLQEVHVMSQPLPTKQTYSTHYCKNRTLSSCVTVSHAISPRLTSIHWIT